MLSLHVRSVFGSVRDSDKRITVLSGAGISAESGVPTFRGQEGYWTVGSVNYRPEEMATYAMFQREPDEVWRWYLYRRSVCQTAKPNAGHLALVELEQLIGDRFRLITQNVDGLHLRAGNQLGRTYQIHGNINFMRCFKECSSSLYPVPDTIGHRSKHDPMDEETMSQLVCPDCGSLARPHVLWFDECYNEKHFYFDTAMRRAAQTDILIVVGTSGATNLPMQVGFRALQRGATLFDININRNPFSTMADESQQGGFIEGTAAAILPHLVELVKNHD